MSLTYGVVVPAHNAERTLAQAIESLLAQTVAPSRIVVVDDGSDDATPRVASSFGDAVQLIRQPNRGPGAATDRGLAGIEEPIVAGLDADDVWFPEKAAAQIDALLQDPGLDGVFCHAVVFAHGTTPDPSGRSHPLWGRSAMMLRRAAITRIGPVSLCGVRTSGEMIDWFARGRELGLRFGLCPRVLVGRRRIAGSLAESADASSLLPVVRAALERKHRRG